MEDQKRWKHIESNKVKKDYFLEEYNRFRDIMCSSVYSIDKKLEAYKGLFFVYMNLDPNQPKEDEELCQTAMTTLDMELNMRLGIQMRMDIEALVANAIEEGIKVG